MPDIYTFESDGSYMPAGQYLVTIWDVGKIDLAWRREAKPMIVWSPPIQGEERGIT